MSGLEQQKATDKLHLEDVLAPKKGPVINEDTLRQMLSMFRYFVTQKNIPECKKFIQSFVDKIIVFKDHVEVVLIVSAAPDGGNGLTIRSEETIKEIRGKFKVA